MDGWMEEDSSGESLKNLQKRNMKEPDGDQGLGEMDDGEKERGMRQGRERGREMEGQRTREWKTERHREGET